VRPEKRLATAMLQLSFALLCGACAGTHAQQVRPSCPVPDDVQLEIEASDRVNPDEDGRALPTRLRLYQLTDLTRLQGASFDDVWTHPKETLAQSALNSEELIIYPGQVVVHRFKRSAEADYVVAVAVFREPEGDGWRTAQEFPLPGDPCGSQPPRAPADTPRLSKLRVRLFLDGDRIESVNNYAQLPKRRCARDAPDCEGAVRDTASELRRNRRLRSFEEDSREPEITRPPHD
jgi:type VI secretion system protein VasD